MIIDPGTMADEILHYVKETDLQIKVIVLTHGHMDHTGALAAVKQDTGAEIAIHAEDAPFLRAGNPTMRAAGGSPEEAPTPDRLLKEGDVIDLGEYHFKVLHTPGHTPGGICLLEDGIVFTGDTLFQFSVGRTDFPGGSHDLLIENIQTKLMTLPDDTKVCPGHGPDTTVAIERRINPFL
jgi:glyoxylase-like metal-dependent hydrolase (beta-lactamase superfamily II)